MAGSLNEHQRAQLDALLDQLIPANAQRGVAAAGASGTGDFIEDRMAGDTSLSSDILSLLTCAQSISETQFISETQPISDTQAISGQITTATVRQLEERLPQAFSVLLRLTYMGYYSRSENRASVGVGASPVHPKGYIVAAESRELLEQMLEPVRTRGPVFREA